MKLVTVGITAFLLCHTICAQNLFDNQYFKNIGFQPEWHQIRGGIYTKNFTDIYWSGIDSKLNFPLHGADPGAAYLNATMAHRSSPWDDGLKMKMKTRTLISAGLFIPSIATGYLMRGSGGNPNDGLLAVHKLSTVSNLVLLDMTVLKKRKTASLTWLEKFVAITMNASFLATITTGSLQSVEGTVPGWVNTSHQITPWATVLSSGILLYLLNK